MRVLVFLKSSRFSSWVIVLGGGFLPPVSVMCVCVRSRLGAFGFLWERGKKCVTNVKDVEVGKPIWHVPMFICI